MIGADNFPRRMKQKIKGTPPRLSVVYQRFEAPLYLVTFNTLFRRPLLAHDSVHTAFQHYAEQGLAFHVGTGRYVLMPDHVHVFVRIGPDMTLRRWIGGLKQCLGKALRALGHEPVAQRVWCRVEPAAQRDRAIGSTLQQDRATGSTLQQDRYIGSRLQPASEAQARRCDNMKLKSFWQPGFFDHLLRGDESYLQKWDCVWHNPVRANLVGRPEDWPYQGEIHRIDQV